MNSYKKLISNSAIFAIGRLGSNLISFILVPLYTFYLTTIEYGTVDLVVTTVNMLLPIVSVSMFDAILRFIMDKQDDADSIMVNAISVSVIGYFIALLIIPIVINFNLIGNTTVVIYMYLILFFQIFERIFSEYARAIGEVKTFAINGIILTFSIGVLNVVFLAFFNLKISGYFLSIILANIISIIYLVFSTKVYKHIKYSLIRLDRMKPLLSYSIPLIPNALMWWMINASSRYFIRFFIGVSANGLFAVSSRIPTLITIINQIFMQAWQLSAIEEYKSKDKSKFYSTVFNHLASILFIGASAALVILKPLFNILFATEYYIAWKVVPFLLLSAIFSSFSSFLGTNYIAAKQTNGVFKTSIYGGIVSLALNLILISKFGIIGAGVSSMFSFMVMWLLRLRDTKQFIKMETNWKLITFNSIFISLQIIVMFSDLVSINEQIILLLIFLIELVVNKNLLVQLKALLFKLIRKK